MSEPCSPRLRLCSRQPDGIPSYLERRKNLNYCSPQGGKNQLRLWLSQGAAVRRLKFSSGVFCFLSTPVPVVSEHAGLPLSLSEQEPFLQGVVWPEMVLRALKAAADAGNSERCLIWCPLMPVQLEAGRLLSKAAECIFQKDNACKSAFPTACYTPATRSAVTHDSQANLDCSCGCKWAASSGCSTSHQPALWSFGTCSSLGYHVPPWSCGRGPL